MDGGLGFSTQEMARQTGYTAGADQNWAIGHIEKPHLSSQLSKPLPFRLRNLTLWLGRKRT